MTTGTKLNTKMDIELQNYKQKDEEDVLFDDVQSISSRTLVDINQVAGNSSDLEAYMEGIEYTADLRKTLVSSNIKKKVGLAIFILWLLTLLFYTFTG